MTIIEAREIIGEENLKYSDSEILGFIDTAELFKGIFFEEIRKITKEERKLLV